MTRLMGKRLHLVLLMTISCAVIYVNLLASSVPALFAQQEKRYQPYRLPAVELKDRILWGSTCEPAPGEGLAFGGEDQQAEDGRPHTRVLRDGEWVIIRAELEKGNPWQSPSENLFVWSETCAQTIGLQRMIYFEGSSPKKKNVYDSLDDPALSKLLNDLLGQLSDCYQEALSTSPSDSYAVTQGRYARNLLTRAVKLAGMIDLGKQAVDQHDLAAMAELRRLVELTAAALDCEPPPRALSPLCYDEQRKVYYLFGGDHLDYLTCDLWVFDPAVPQWRQLHPKESPPPRANHQLTLNNKGQVVLTGGYGYFSNTDYLGGQYEDLLDGEWIYDVASNQWTGTGKTASPDERTYRTGPFDPAYFWKGRQPDKGTFQKTLAGLPANEWVKLDSSLRPEVNRDWGTAVLDPTHDLILRFSGGHSAHGGSDVPHFHLPSGRWELPFAVEFPLGQLYSNTSYPEGFNFNRRPWVTGHTYKSYAFDEVSQRMVFVGETNYTYLYDPLRGDWTGERIKKPDGMNYGSCFYTLTLCPTDHGTFCWTNAGRLFRWERTDDTWQWRELELKGEKLPGSVVDRAGLAYDSQRERLLFTTKPYEGPFDGQVYAVDVNSWEVTRLDPPNCAAMTNVGFLREVVYLPELDLMLQGMNFPLQEGQPRLTPAFDCASHRWIALEFAGEDPSGREGRNVSLGLMYDAARKLVWAVDTHSHVYVLRVNARTLVKHFVEP